MTNIRVRFPPSPTGNLHIGNARTALFNFLFARHHGGSFIFRIEDTDTARSRECFVENEIAALQWLGLEWDEGILRGGSLGPYKQSERSSLYLEAVQKLLDSGKAYVCFCSPEELEQERMQCQETVNAFKYSGKCRTLTKQQIEQKLTTKVPHTVRFKLPEVETVVLHDLIRGTMTFPVDSLDDFILLRSDGTSTYNLAVMIDDALMKISHVIRGEDHLFGNTPRQILLYHALGFALPEFGHMPMVLGSDRTKLSKRHGAFAVSDYREMGFLPEALTNYMALLGWSPGNDIEIMSMQEMISSFDLSNIQVSPAVFDLEKLKWLNGQYLRKKIAKDLIDDMQQIDPSFDKLVERYPQDFLEQVFESLKSYATLLTDMPKLIASIEALEGLEKENLNHLCIAEAKSLLEHLVSDLQEVEEWNPDHIKMLIKSVGKRLSLKGKSLFHPLRYALSNSDQGYDLNIIIYALGKTKTIQLINKAIALMGEEK